MSSVFSKIIRGDLPCFQVYQNELVFAFLALDQIHLGHTLVIPQKEVDHFADMDEESYQAVFSASKLISKAIQRETQCQRVLLAIQGFEVPHAHVHLIPAWGPEDLSFSKARRLSSESMEDMAQRLRRQLESSHS